MALPSPIPAAMQRATQIDSHFSKTNTARWYNGVCGDLTTHAIEIFINGFR